MPSPIDPPVRWSRSFRAAFRPCPSFPPFAAIPRPSAPSTSTTTSTTTTTTVAAAAAAVAAVSLRARKHVSVAARWSQRGQPRPRRAREGYGRADRECLFPSRPPTLSRGWSSRGGALRRAAPAKIHRRWPEQNCRARAAAARNTRPDRSSPPPSGGLSLLSPVFHPCCFRCPPLSARHVRLYLSLSLFHPQRRFAVPPPRLHSSLSLSFSFSSPASYIATPLRFFLSRANRSPTKVFLSLPPAPPSCLSSRSRSRSSVFRLHRLHFAFDLRLSTLILSILSDRQILPTSRYRIIAES